MTSNWDRYPSKSRRSRGIGWNQLRARVLNRDEHTCQLRGPNCVVVGTECDHVIPVSQGGTDDMTNLVAACVPCHRTKSQREAAAGRRRHKRAPSPHPSDYLGGSNDAA